MAANHRSRQCALIPGPRCISDCKIGVVSDVRGDEEWLPGELKQAMVFSCTSGNKAHKILLRYGKIGGYGCQHGISKAVGLHEDMALDASCKAFTLLHIHL